MGLGVVGGTAGVPRSRSARTLRKPSQEVRSRQHTFQVCALAFIPGRVVRDLGGLPLVGLGGCSRTQANEIANETAAVVGGMTPARLASEILLDPDARRDCAPEPVAPRRVVRVASAVGIRLTQMASHGVIGKFGDNAHRAADMVGDPGSWAAFVAAPKGSLCVPDVN